jgi:hypothetical protein
MNKEQLFTIFSNIYGDPSYFQENKHVIITCVFYFFLLFVICSYIYYLTNVESIKNNWVENRCKLSIMPFAGWINAPEGVSPGEYTSQNFTFCVQNMVTTFTQYLLLPIQFIISIVISFFTLLSQSINNIRERINVLKQAILKIVNEIYNRAVNVIVPFNIIFIKFEDIIEKLKGVLASVMYSILGVYYAIKSTMGIILDFVIAILFTLTGILVGLIATASALAATAFINPAAAVMLPIIMTMISSYVVLFLSISIPSALIMIFCITYLKMQSKKFPSLPTCFDKSVNVRMSDNTYKHISHIKPGDVLYDNNKVEAIMMCAMTDKQSLFYLNNDLVTSYHRVSYGMDNPEWIYIKDHPNSIERNLYNPEMVYCLNTSNKTIITQINKYLDWDDIIVINNENENENNRYIEKCSNNDDIIETRHGFDWNTFIMLPNQTFKPICKIKIGDELYLGYKVIGIVLIIKNNENTYITKKSIWDENVEDYMDKYNFHLITDSGLFYIFDNKHGKKVIDYSDTEYTNVKNYPI